MNKNFAQMLAARFHQQPILIAKGYESMLLESLRTFETMPADYSQANDKLNQSVLLKSYGQTSSSADKPFAFAQGLAFIPVHGLLINRYNYSGFGVTGYNFIRNQMNAALADNDVDGIVFDCNSCGGEVSGCFELAEDIYKSRSIKPSVAVVDPHCYSACYAIASSASKVVLSRSAGAGSVGVVCMHFDVSKFLSDIGIKVTYIFSGDHKVDGNMFEPLPEAVYKSIKSRVDATRTEFVALVATNRSLSSKVVYDTEAACFTAKEALDIGFIDAIAQPYDAVMAFLTEQSRSQHKMESPMATETKQSGENATAQNVDENAVRAAERKRASDIMTHANAKGREGLAKHLAFNTNMSVDEAAATLAATPIVAATSTSAFTQAMNNGQHPNISPEGNGDAPAGETVAQRIIKNHKLVAGASA